MTLTTTPAPAAPPRKRRNGWRYYAIEYTSWWLLFTLLIVGFIATPLFFTASNLLNVIEQSAIIGVLALGQFLVILTGGIDLSVGSMLALTAMVGASTIGLGWPVAVAASVVVGGLLGAFNGLAIVLGKLPPFIVTFAMLAIARGLALTMTNGAAINLPSDSGFAFIGSGLWPAVVWAVAVLAVYALLRRTRTGTHVFAVGGNIEAARVSGVRTGGILILVYALSAVGAAIAGLLFMARSGVSLPTYGNGYELQTIAAVVVGGVNLFGGEGKVTGAVIGVIFMTMLSNILDLIAVNPFWSFCVIGVVLWAAIMLRAILQEAR